MLNNQNNALKINFDELSVEDLSIDELVDYYIEELSKREILCKVNIPSRAIFIKGTFEEDVWAIYRDLKKNYRYLNFSKLNKFEYKNISKKQRLLIKCWVSQRLLDNYIEFNESDNASSKGRASERTVDNLNTLSSFIINSDNFSSEFLDKTKGDNIKFFFDERTNGYTPPVIRKYINSVLGYLQFCLFKCKVDTHIFSEKNYYIYYERVLYLYNNVTGTAKLTKDSKSNLPSGHNILLFDYYIKTFFNSNTSELLKNYYYPLFIWWRLTNIIPMRISELCDKLQRDCLFIKDNKYYIKINRAKKSNKQGELPILTDYLITKEFYDLINDYILRTDKFGTTNTLFSYKAQLFFRAELAKNNPLFYSKNSTVENSRKYDDTYYSYDPLTVLLDTFYDKIIGKYFNDSLITERITLNDTRHFAFTSLVLQGIPLVEIAILGGHSDTNTVNDYSYDNNCYIDTQVFKNLNKSLAHYKTSKSKVSNIIFDMPKVCPVPIENCVETSFSDIPLGYCTAQTEYACESYDCYNCSKWYCEPTYKNFNTLYEITQIDLDSRSKELKHNMDFMIKLFKSSSILYSENPDTEIHSERNWATQLNELSNKIQSDTEEIIKIKSKLLEGFIDIECNELDIIEKLKYLNKTFTDDTKYLE